MNYSLQPEKFVLAYIMSQHKIVSITLQNCCNWVSSSEPLDTSVESMLPDCPRVSAGMCLMRSVWSFFLSEKYANIMWNSTL